MVSRVCVCIEMLDEVAKEAREKGESNHEQQEQEEGDEDGDGEEQKAFSTKGTLWITDFLVACFTKATIN
ncbi:hypothetical protein OIU78_029129 [Salix suchowensis]|nr:hypothetical protein OIU78_029129 [Salix suchowensis]